MSDDARRLILARRARFVAAALASVAATTSTLVASLEACGGEVETASGDRGRDRGEPRPCLSAPELPDRPPQPCLGAVPDEDAGAADASDEDAEPQPCLAPRLPDAG
ncbi:MAG: hypothetical protein KF894_32805 [Labilithrix sp.]|nr:hypothetical protein [Labilithrix sp.]